MDTNTIHLEKNERLVGSATVTTWDVMKGPHLISWHVRRRDALSALKAIMDARAPKPEPTADVVLTDRGLEFRYGVKR